MSIGSLLAKAAGIAIGTFSLTIWCIIAVWKGPKSPRPLDRDVARAQHELWSLEKNGDAKCRIQHHFLSLREGLQMHYISPANQTKKTKLVVFLHGFPDSCHTFAHFLDAPLAEHANAVSLDLPGYGGSDGLHRYGADDVLNALVNAILLLKERYLDGEDKAHQCVLVGHDWGGAISSRLAMETQGLVDRVVIVNAPVLKLFAMNLQSGIKTAGAHLRAWRQDWSNTQPLSDAREALRPVLAQLVCSNYIFIFGLPFFHMRYCRFFMEFLLGWCHVAAARGSEAPSASWSWASSMGPGVDECTTSGHGMAYGEDVGKRAMRCPAGDWDTRIRLYNEGLFSGDWTLRVHRKGRGVKQVKAEQDARFQYPASIVFGLKDPALDYRICVKGVERLFRARSGKNETSSVILMKDCGHWSPLEATGTKVINELLLEHLGVTTRASKGEDAGVQRSKF